jgi:ATP-dependent exoDNAse (exonuclease V) beta subunit
MTEPLSEPQPDAAVRVRALDPARSFIVQAPAGSGKTELLIQRYLRLLASVQQPEHILAITFTRKAAAEMQARVLQALAAADQPAPESSHKRITWELARSVRRSDAALGWNLQQNATRLRIQTIDSLNSLLARRLPVISGAGAALTPAEKPDGLYREAVEQLLRRLVDEPEIAGHLETLVLHLGHGVERLLSLLIHLLKKREQWLDVVMSARRSPDLRDTLEAALRGVVARHLLELCEALDHATRIEMWDLCQIAAGYLQHEAKLSEVRRAGVQWALRTPVFPHDDVDSFPAWRLLTDTFFKLDGTPYSSLNKRLGGIPAADAANQVRAQRILARLAQDTSLCELLAAVRELPALTYSDAQWRVLAALLEALPLAVAELQLAFQAHSQADYVEIALRALRALGTPEEPTDLALAFDGRIDHLLVDEFQDTSAAQLDLLQRLTAGWTPGDGRTLFCVGDPMQSIYRFRQAEVGLFLTLQHSGLPNVSLESLQLTTNFRATAPLVSWLNRVFARVLPQRDDAELGEVKYSPSVAALNSNDGGVSFHPLASAQHEAAKAVELVRAALSEDGESNVAILVNAKNHATVICAELARAQIAFKAVEIAQLAEVAVVQDLLALTRALVHGADRTAWLAILRAPWCGLLLEDLHALAGANEPATIRELLSQCLQEPPLRALSADGRRRAERLYEVMELALQQCGRYTLREWVLRTWNSLGGPATLHDEQDLADAEAFFARLDLLEQAGDLPDVNQLEADLASLFAKPHRQAGARVEVMTIHKAKGLEFDTVILPSLHRAVRGSDAELLRWTRTPADAAGQPGVVLAPAPQQGAPTDAIYQWAQQLERRRMQAERGRLLYVAATRAKRHLHLLGYVERVPSDQGLVPRRAPHPGSMLRMLWHELEGLVPPAAAVAAQDPSVPLRIPVQRLPLQWEEPPPDAPAHAPRTLELEAMLERLPFDWASETARHVGTVVHRELERLTRGAAPVAGLDLPSQRFAVELAELGVPAERRGAACQRVSDALERTLHDPRGRWLLGLDRDIETAQSELAVTAVVEGRVVSAVIDRTFIDAEGTRWIIDFKTSTHEGGGLESFLQEEVNRYRAQLAVYVRLMQALQPAQRVRAALYFPLLQQWREVAVG